jgi:hypothetical protein
VEAKSTNQDISQRGMPGNQMVLLEDHGGLPAMSSQHTSTAED